MRRLSDNEIHDRLMRARALLGDEPAETRRGQTTLTAARRALAALPIALLEAGERDADEVAGITPHHDGESAS